MLKNCLIAILTLLTGFFAYKGELPKNETPTSTILIESEVSWNGDSLPDYPFTKPKVSILKITIPPRGELPMHFHPVINAGILLKGELLVKDEDGKSLEMKAGDPIIEVVNKKHWGVNTGTESAEIVVFYAGSEGMKITEVVGD